MTEAAKVQGPVPMLATEVQAERMISADLREKVRSLEARVRSAENRDWPADAGVTIGTPRKTGYPVYHELPPRRNPSVGCMENDHFSTGSRRGHDEPAEAEEDGLP